MSTSKKQMVEDIKAGKGVYANIPKEQREIMIQHLTAPSDMPVSFKVSEKGALSLYGLGRFPVTLYGSQWVKLLAAVDQIKATLEANKDKLKNKETEANTANATKA